MVLNDLGLPFKHNIDEITSQRNSCTLSMFLIIPSQNPPLLVLSPILKVLVRLI